MSAAFDALHLTCIKSMNNTGYNEKQRIAQLLKKDGWCVERQSGSHIIMKHTQKEGQLSVPLHASKEVKKGLLNAILKKAKIKTTRR